MKLASLFRTLLTGSSLLSLTALLPVGCAAEDTASTISPDDTARSGRDLIANPATGRWADGCQIELTWGCPAYPTLPHDFIDNYENASADAARCKRRAVEYANFCALPAGQFAESIYVANGQLSATSTTMAYADGCAIKLGACPRYPTMPGQFYDTYDGANVNQARCMQRAQEYNGWCGKPTTDYTVVEFYQGGDRVAAQTEYVPGSDGCIVNVNGTCRAHPELVRKAIQDTWDGANVNPTRCLARAKDYANYCDNYWGDSPVLATVVRNNHNVNGTFADADGCFVSLSVCSNQRLAPGQYKDTYNGSNVNRDVCAQRAQQYYSYCGNENPPAGWQPINPDYPFGRPVVWADFSRVGSLFVQGETRNNATYPPQPNP